MPVSRGRRGGLRDRGRVSGRLGEHVLSRAPHLFDALQQWVMVCIWIFGTLVKLVFDIVGWRRGGVGVFGLAGCESGWVRVALPDAWAWMEVCRGEHIRRLDVCCKRGEEWSVRGECGIVFFALFTKLYIAPFSFCANKWHASSPYVDMSVRIRMRGWSVKAWSIWWRNRWKMIMQAHDQTTRNSNHSWLELSLSMLNAARVKLTYL